jgi:hypothetical protein
MFVLVFAPKVMYFGSVLPGKKAKLLVSYQQSSLQN